MADLSKEDLERIVQELLRQEPAERERAVTSRNSFMQFLEDAGLMFIFRKIGDGLQWVLDNILDIFF